ncbi:transposase domain-containing protein, partial [Sphingomonas sanguinis]
LYTVIQTCKANGVDPQTYIADVIAKVAADWPASRWDELMPWNWMPPVDQPIAQAA